MGKLSRLLPSPNALIWYGVVERAPYSAVFHVVTVIVAAAVFALLAVWSAATQGYTIRTQSSNKYYEKDLPHWYDPVVPSSWAREDICDAALFRPGDLISTSSGSFAWSIIANGEGQEYRGQRLGNCTVSYVEIEWDFGGMTCRYDTGITCTDHSVWDFGPTYKFTHSDRISRESTLRLEWGVPWTDKADDDFSFSGRHAFNSAALFTLMNKIAQHLYEISLAASNTSSQPRPRMTIRARATHNSSVEAPVPTGPYSFGSITAPLNLTAVSVELGDDLWYDDAALQLLSDRNMIWFTAVMHNSINILVTVLGSDFLVKGDQGRPIGVEMLERGLNTSWTQPLVTADGIDVPIYQPVTKQLKTWNAALKSFYEPWDGIEGVEILTLYICRLSLLKKPLAFVVSVAASTFALFSAVWAAWMMALVLVIRAGEPSRNGSVSKKDTSHGIGPSRTSSPTWLSLQPLTSASAASTSRPSSPSQGYKLIW